MKSLMLLALCLVALVATPAAAAPAVQEDLVAYFAPATGLTPCEETMLLTLNESRAKVGLAALVVDESLQNEARAHAAWMVSRKSLTHGANAIECIGWNYRDSRHIILGWLGSPGHRAICLGRYTHVGLAGYTDEKGQTWWCARFRAHPGPIQRLLHPELRNPCKEGVCVLKAEAIVVPKKAEVIPTPAPVQKPTLSPPKSDCCTAAAKDAQPACTEGRTRLHRCHRVCWHRCR